MELEINKTIVKKRNVRLSKDKIGIQIKVDNYTIAEISNKGHLRIYVQSLQNLGLEADAFSNYHNKSDTVKIIDIIKLFNK